MGVGEMGWRWWWSKKDLVLSLHLKKDKTIVGVHICNKHKDHKKNAHKNQARTQCEGKGVNE